MDRKYIAFIKHGGGFGNGYGGTYCSEIEFMSSHRANSKANKHDAEKQWKSSHKLGWVEVENTYLAKQ